MDDELQLLIAACEDLRRATRECCGHAIQELDPTRPADAVVPYPLREVVKTPYAAYVAFEGAVERAIAAAADAAAEPAP